MDINYDLEEHELTKNNEVLDKEIAYLVKLLSKNLTLHPIPKPSNGNNIFTPVNNAAITFEEMEEEETEDTEMEESVEPTVVGGSSQATIPNPPSTMNSDEEEVTSKPPSGVKLKISKNKPPSVPIGIRDARKIRPKKGLFGKNLPDPMEL